MKRSLELIRCNKPRANQKNVCVSSGFVDVNFKTAKDILKNLDGHVIDFPDDYDIELFQLLERPIFIKGEKDPYFIYTLVAAGITFDEKENDFVSSDYEVAIYGPDQDDFVPCKIKILE